MFKKNKNKNNAVMKKSLAVAKEMHAGSERTDPGGSYTGMVVGTGGKNEKPIQDADDI